MENLTQMDRATDIRHENGENPSIEVYLWEIIQRLMITKLSVIIDNTYDFSKPFIDIPIQWTTNNSGKNNI